MIQFSAGAGRSDNTDDTDALEEVESNPTFQKLFDDAKLDNEKDWLEKVEKFKTEGSSQKEAEMKANGDKFFETLEIFSV